MQPATRPDDRCGRREQRQRRDGPDGPDRAEGNEEDVAQEPEQRVRPEVRREQVEVALEGRRRQPVAQSDGHAGGRRDLEGQGVEGPEGEAPREQQPADPQPARGRSRWGKPRVHGGRVYLSFGASLPRGRRGPQKSWPRGADVRSDRAFAHAPSRVRSSLHARLAAGGGRRGSGRSCVRSRSTQGCRCSSWQEWRSCSRGGSSSARCASPSRWRSPWRCCSSQPAWAG